MKKNQTKPQGKESKEVIELMVLVDSDDNELGVMEKIETHKQGLLHRAFSGFVFNNKGELLIQKRSSTKYHNPGIWGNTVCSHPRLGESIEQGVKRRLHEELGFELDFKVLDYFIYKATFPNGLTEHELDHVCVAKYDNQEIIPNPEEVAEIRWISLADLKREIESTPEKFAFWLKEILNKGILKRISN